VQDRKEKLKNGEVVLGLATAHAQHEMKLGIGAKLMQLCPGDQTGYPNDTIESFVGHSSMGLLCPPANLQAIEAKT